MRSEKDNTRQDVSSEGVRHQEHYSCFELEPLTYIIVNKLGFCEGNIIKYVTRYKHKGGLEDLLKAEHYLHILIEEEKHEQKTPSSTL